MVPAAASTAPSAATNAPACPAADHRVRCLPDTDGRQRDTEPAHRGAGKNPLDDRGLCCTGFPEPGAPVTASSRNSAPGRGGGSSASHGSTLPDVESPRVSGKLPLGAGQLLAVGEPLQVPAQTGPPLQAAELARLGVVAVAAAQLGSLPIGILGDHRGAQARFDVLVLGRERVGFGPDLGGHAIIGQAGNLRQAGTDLGCA